MNLKLLTPLVIILAIAGFAIKGAILMVGWSFVLDQLHIDQPGIGYWPAVFLTILWEGFNSKVN